MSTYAKPLLLLCLVAFALWLLYSPDPNTSAIRGFYRAIALQERVKSDVSVTEADLEEIRACQDPRGQSGSPDECLRSFYDDYTMQHGVEDAFAHLARLQKENPDLLRSCHYISHGIGHAALRLADRDPAKAFSVLGDDALFRNISTCGNGYFHGVVEELAKDIKDENALVAALRPLCEATAAVGGGDCYHGVGHAALTQLKYDVPAMLRVCDRMSEDPSEVFFCDSGGFMEYPISRSHEVVFDGTTMHLKLCDSLDTKYQPACYIERSSDTEDLFSDKRTDYAFLMGLCKQIPNALNRMACVKLLAIRAVRIAHYEDIPRMCSNTSTAEERVMCTAVVARKIAFSLERDPGAEMYTHVVRTLCDTLEAPYASYCSSLVLHQDNRLFYTSEADLTVSSLP